MLYTCRHINGAKGLAVISVIYACIDRYVFAQNEPTSDLIFRCMVTLQKGR